MKRLLVVIAVLLLNDAIAQKGIKHLVAAEKDFAAYALSTSTRQAFLKFMDSAAILFDKADTINGLKLWTRNEERPTKLWWQPAYAEISASNDFGFTTGPWRFYQRSVNDAPSATGHFITVWHMDSHHHWRFLIDLGIHYSNSTSDTVLHTTVNVGKKQSVKTNFMETEKGFVELFKRDAAGAYKKYLSTNSRLNRNEHLPAVSFEQKENYISTLPAGVQLIPLGNFVSPSNDLAAVFGNSIFENKKESYLHIWRKEKGGWKLACEVLHL